MSAPTEDISPSQHLAYAWNSIQCARSVLPKPLYDRMTRVLQELDKTLLELCPKANPEPIPLTGFPCDGCGSNAHG